MYLFVSLDTGSVAAVASAADPARDPAVRAALDVGTLDVFRFTAAGVESLGFDGAWSPVDRASAAADFLAALPKPVMARLPDEPRPRKVVA